MASNPSGSGTSHLGDLKEEVSYSYLVGITHNFSRPIGTPGSFGTVYKGTLSNGVLVAVKKHERDAPGTDMEENYRKNARAIMNHRHVNVAKLHAFCLEYVDTTQQYSGGNVKGKTAESLFCYEYFSHGNLRTLLFGRTAEDIHWDKRFEIIKGICLGLQSLHRADSGILMHLNLKPENILLDKKMDNNMVPKITDFVYTRLVGGPTTHKRTNSKVGSVGYKSPEFLDGSEISRKADIYALGLIILEIITRKENIPDKNSGSARDYINEVEKTWKDRDTKETIMLEYEKLDAVRREQVDICIKTALECVELQKTRRPTIDKIVKDLSA